MNGSRAAVAGWQAAPPERAGRRMDGWITVLFVAVVAALTAVYVGTNAGATYPEAWAELAD